MVLQGQEKMSKSDPASAIFMEDSEAEVKTKVKKAFCAPGEVATALMATAHLQPCMRPCTEHHSQWTSCMQRCIFAGMSERHPCKQSLPSHCRVEVISML